MGKKIFLLTQILILIILMTPSLQAQNIAGDWYGILSVKGHQLKLIFHIEQKDTLLTSTMDSPDQHASGLKVDETRFSNNELFINASSLKISYKGIANSSMDTINGTFVQGSANLSLILTKREPEKRIVTRSQDPKDFPYYREDVQFKNAKADITLAGTLTLPENKKVTKVVIMITGSGPQNRDEEILEFNHRPFLVWSDWLTKQGIGVLRYDDRGVGKSTGKYSGSSTSDFADDAEAAVEYISQRSDMKNIEIGLIGHSEGGMIAPMIALKNSKVRFVVMLAAVGLPSDKLLLEQMEDINALSNVAPEKSKRQIRTEEKIFEYLKINRTETVSEELSQGYIDGLKRVIDEEFSHYPKEAFEGKTIDEMTNTYVKVYTGKWLRNFILCDPTATLEKIMCPVLALNGTLDCQVRCKSNLDAIKKCLNKAKNSNFEVIPMEGLNHIFQKAKTGSVSEYSQIEETVNPAALQKVSEWINKLK